MNLMNGARFSCNKCGIVFDNSTFSLEESMDMILQIYDHCNEVSL